ncbi:hypothetical protein DPM33_27235 [Mesorhizobium hawassense]|uniref:Uncharacterized protein n=1 Tax=Mesorhizobium hawassense TaxID=1209954 RepID=A0A330HHP4_9HYPH|nr:hypothetical protein [Mesorhizobium hawassense]RAZ87032.1 hypothetical protein DPM33_27235 [Mesorhizobium hawassense]
MQRAKRNWAIYRAWEDKFHAGATDVKSHPGHSGIDAEYDELGAWLDDQITRLPALPLLYRAKFRALPGQEGLTPGIMRELEVTWSPSPNQADKVTSSA